MQPPEPLPLLSPASSPVPSPVLRTQQLVKQSPQRQPSPQRKQGTALNNDCTGRFESMRQRSAQDVGAHTLPRQTQQLGAGAGRATVRGAAPTAAGPRTQLGAVNGSAGRGDSASGSHVRTSSATPPFPRRDTKVSMTAGNRAQADGAGTAAAALGSCGPIASEMLAIGAISLGGGVGGWDDQRAGSSVAGGLGVFDAYASAGAAEEAAATDGCARSSGVESHSAAAVAAAVTGASSLVRRSAAAAASAGEAVAGNGAARRRGSCAQAGTIGAAGEASARCRNGSGVGTAAKEARTGGRGGRGAGNADSLGEVPGSTAGSGGGEGQRQHTIAAGRQRARGTLSAEPQAHAPQGRMPSDSRASADSPVPVYRHYSFLKGPEELHSLFEQQLEAAGAVNTKDPRVWIAVRVASGQLFDYEVTLRGKEKPYLSGVASLVQAMGLPDNGTAWLQRQPDGRVVAWADNPLQPELTLRAAMEADLRTKVPMGVMRRLLGCQLEKRALAQGLTVRLEDESARGARTTKADTLRRGQKGNWYLAGIRPWLRKLEAQQGDKLTFSVEWPPEAQEASGSAAGPSGAGAGGSALPVIVARLRRRSDAAAGLQQAARAVAGTAAEGAGGGGAGGNDADDVDVGGIAAGGDDIGSGSDDSSDGGSDDGSDGGSDGGSDSGSDDGSGGGSGDAAYMAAAATAVARGDGGGKRSGGRSGADRTAQGAGDSGAVGGTGAGAGDGGGGDTRAAAGGGQQAATSAAALLLQRTTEPVHLRSAASPAQRMLPGWPEYRRNAARPPAQDMQRPVDAQQAEWRGGREAAAPETTTLGEGYASAERAALLPTSPGAGGARAGLPLPPAAAAAAPGTRPTLLRAYSSIPFNSKPPLTPTTSLPHDSSPRSPSPIALSPGSAHQSPSPFSQLPQTYSTSGSVPATPAADRPAPEAIGIASAAEGGGTVPPLPPLRGLGFTGRYGWPLNGAEFAPQRTQPQGVQLSRPPSLHTTTTTTSLAGSAPPSPSFVFPPLDTPQSPVRPPSAPCPPDATPPPPLPRPRSLSPAVLSTPERTADGVNAVNTGRHLSPEATDAGQPLSPPPNAIPEAAGSRPPQATPAAAAAAAAAAAPAEGYLAATNGSPHPNAASFGHIECLPGYVPPGGLPQLLGRHGLRECGSTFGPDICIHRARRRWEQSTPNIRGKPLQELSPEKEQILIPGAGYQVPDTAAGAPITAQRMRERGLDPTAVRAGLAGVLGLKRPGCSYAPLPEGYLVAADPQGVPLVAPGPDAVRGGTGLFARRPLLKNGVALVAGGYVSPASEGSGESSFVRDGHTKLSTEARTQLLWRLQGSSAVDLELAWRFLATYHRVPLLSKVEAKPMGQRVAA